MAFARHAWMTGSITRDTASVLLWRVRDLVRPEHELAAIRPAVTLEDADSCVAQGLPAAEQYQRVDDTLHQMFQHYAEYEPLLPEVRSLRLEA